MNEKFNIGLLCVADNEPYFHFRLLNSKSLKTYNNNLIQFSAPVEVDLELNFNLFQVLFQKFIFSEEQFEPIRKSTLIEFVDLNESEKVIEVMKNRGVKPVL